MEVTEIVLIEDPDDPRYRQFRLNERGLASRADKRDDAGAGMFLAEGDLVVERALAAGCRPVAALVDAERVPDIAASLDCPVYGGGVEVRKVVSQLGVPLSIITLFDRPARPSVAELAATAKRLVIVEAVDNPANIGSIIRNAAALGWDGLILDHTSADPLARRSLRVGMGTVFSLPHARTTDLAGELRALEHIEFYAMTPDPDRRLDPFDHPRRPHRRDDRFRTLGPQRRTPRARHPGAHPDGGRRRLAQRRCRDRRGVLRTRPPGLSSTVERVP